MRKKQKSLEISISLELFQWSMLMELLVEIIDLIFQDLILIGSGNFQVKECILKYFG